MADCSVGGCPKEAKIKRMCWGHYCSNRRYGDPEYSSPAQRQLRRFWDNVVKRETGCWEWTGTVLSHDTCLPYGRIYFDGKQQTAHRVSWLIHSGELPEDRLVLHHCDNPRCVNPAHLYLGNHTDNARDRVERNRCNTPRGEDVKTSKLNPDAVRDILLSESSGRDMTRKYNVSPSLVSLIRLGRVWQHIQGEVHCPR